MEEEPLFVLDGFPLGNSYQRANNAIDMAHVKSIRVVRNLSQMGTYGSMASAGVIEILTREDHEPAARSPQPLFRQK